MDLQPFLTQYLPPMLATVIVALAALLLMWWLASRGVGTRLWRTVVRYRGPLAFLFAVVLFAVSFMTFVVRTVGQQGPQEDLRGFTSPANLMYGVGFTQVPFTSTVYTADKPLSNTPPVDLGWEAEVPAEHSLVSPLFAVRPRETSNYTFYAEGEGEGTRVQGRLLWYDKGLNVLSWDDSPVWPAGQVEYRVGSKRAPEGAAYVRLELRNASAAGSTGKLRVSEPRVGAGHAYVEPHPNGAMASVAFSFDWETAMGGAIHSKGNETHDPAAAAEHGMAMREGADWLADLFRRYGMRGTFYATGYNLLDGNTERRAFNGDPIYDWAGPPEWESDYWLTHPWFSDDPFGTVETHPAWYFGDQTRRLLADGHEIAPHTFAHIYVRGSNPAEIGKDLDTWIEVAEEAGVPKPSTFAFPWRSSNSLTREFYDAMYERGIRAVTRIYPLDMKDLYVLSSPLVYTDVRQPQVYGNMAVLPDFLLGAPATEAGEEAGGASIGLYEGLAVLQEAISRRGTTSFWTHPEQLADSPALAPEREAWEGVVQAAAEERDRGRLWVDTVEAITAYQRDVMSVSVMAIPGGTLPEGLRVENASGKELSGVTLSLGVEARALVADGVEMRPVYRTDCEGQDCRVVVGEPVNGALDTYTHQIVLNGLKPGLTEIEVEWDWPPTPQQ